MAQQVDVAELALHSAGGGRIAAADELAVGGGVVEFGGVCADAFIVYSGLVWIGFGCRVGGGGDGKFLKILGLLRA